MIISIYLRLLFKNHFSNAVNRTGGISEIHKLRQNKYNHSLLLQNDHVITLNFFIALLAFAFRVIPYVHDSLPGEFRNTRIHINYFVLVS